MTREFRIIRVKETIDGIEVMVQGKNTNCFSSYWMRGIAEQYKCKMRSYVIIPYYCPDALKYIFFNPEEEAKLPNQQELLKFFNEKLGKIVTYTGSSLMSKGTFSVN